MIDHEIGLIGIRLQPTGQHRARKDDLATIGRSVAPGLPLWPIGTPNLALYQRADTLAHNLEFDVVNTLQGANPLSPATAKAVGLAEAQAFLADFDASLLARPQIGRIADAAVAVLESNLGALDQPGINPSAQAQLAQQQFVTQMFASAGLFGPQGPLGAVFQAPVLYPGGANQTVILDRTVTYANPRPITAHP